MNLLEHASAPAPATQANSKVPDRLAPAVMIASYINGGDAEDRARAVALDGDVLLALAAAESPETVQALSSQLTVLEALFLSLAKASVSCKLPRDRVRLMKASLDAQASYVRTVGLIAKLKRKAESWNRGGYW